MPTAAKKSISKEKIGTILDKEIVRKVKERSLKEGRTINDIIHDALSKYNQNDFTKSEMRQEAAARFCSKPFHIKLMKLINCLMRIITSNESFKYFFRTKSNY